VLKATAKGLSVFWIASPARSSGGSARTEKLANVVSKIANTRGFIDGSRNSGWYYLDRHLILFIAPGLAADGYSADLWAVRRSDEVGLPARRNARWRIRVVVNANHAAVIDDEDRRHRSFIPAAGQGSLFLRLRTAGDQADTAAKLKVGPKPVGQSGDTISDAQHESDVHDSPQPPCG
jgi:hypothetical protein